MKLVMTLVVRDEADVIDDQLAFHLQAGVDFVIATDHRSLDGTTEILESHARDGVLQLIREEGEFIRQSEWQTRMSHLAATEYGADWVIPSDADEFWWPRGAHLKEVLSAVPAGYGYVRALSRNFVPHRDDDGWFAERMTVRLSGQAPIHDPATPFRPVVKVVHRAHPRAAFRARGGHEMTGLPWPLMRGFHPIEILHVPFRSAEQCARKYRGAWTGWGENLRGDLARARAMSDDGRPEAMWHRVSMDEATVERGLADGSLVLDLRLRDVLIALRGRRDDARVLEDARETPFGRPSPAEETRHAVDASLFDEAEIVRVQRWLDELESRMARIERR